MNSTQNNDKIRIVLAEDHHIVRGAVAALLNREPDMEVVGEVADGSNLLDVVEQTMPNVLLLDVQMPHHEPIQSTRAIREQFSDVHVLILSAYHLPEYVIGLLRAGASGYVLKDDLANMLVRAVRAVSRGEEWVSPQATDILLGSFRDDERSSVDRLTERELEVLRLMALGRRNNEIADELAITNQTTKNHITSIFRKLGVETRVEAVLAAISHGYISTKEIREELEP